MELDAFLFYVLQVYVEDFAFPSLPCPMFSSVVRVVDLFVLTLSRVVVLAAASASCGFAAGRLCVSLLLAVEVLSYPNLVVEKFCVVECCVDNKPLLNYFLLDVLCRACDDEGASFLRGPCVSTALLGVGVVDLADCVDLNVFDMSMVLFLDLLS
jgi:hypothetical protein